MAAGVVIFIAAFIEYRHEKNKNEAKQENGSNANTATGGYAIASGNVVNQYFFDGAKVEDLAASLAEKLKTGNLRFSAEEEKIAAAPPRLEVKDGFVQFEEVELQVPSPELQAGQRIVAKYHYANRGALPVYEVQTWGLMQVLDPAKNSGPHLKAVMKAAAEEGHRKFPGAATLGKQRTMHAFAPLSEPLTQEQVTALRNKSSALFLIVGWVWVDNQAKAHFWSVCQMAEFNDTQGLTWNNFAWKDL